MRCQIPTNKVPEGNKIKIISEPQKIKICNRTNAFLRVCKYFSDGTFEQPEINVYELTEAYLHIGTGTVLTKDFRFVADPAMGYRLSKIRELITPANRLRIMQASRFAGRLAAIYEFSGENYWHWTYDCLPRIYSLIQACGYSRLSIAMPKSLPSRKRKFLNYLLKPNIDTIFFEDASWLKVEKLIFPSYVSARANGFLPKSYYEYIKNSVFSDHSLSERGNPSRRFYISRSNAKHRRVINEDQVIHILDMFGFQVVHLENLSFLEEVSLFRDAEMIVAPHGAGIASTVFSGKVKVLILYPNQRPTTFFFTQLQGLGQEHHFLCHDRQGENDDFVVDLYELKAMMEKLVLSKVKP
jgi:capsular polysaccharide biosynthesis protein